MSTLAEVSAIVELDYAAKEASELNLIKGAIIQNVKPYQHQGHGAWWEGCLASGKTGIFQDRYVRFLDGEDKNHVVLR